jgi:hypothetical protein
MRGIQQFFIDIQNRCVLAADQLSRLVIETAGQRPATLNDFQTKSLRLRGKLGYGRQTRLWELSKFQPIGKHQEKIAKKFCCFQIREDSTKLDSATQNAIGFALSRLIDPSPGEPASKLACVQAIAMVHRTNLTVQIRSLLS